MYSSLQRLVAAAAGRPLQAHTDHATQQQATHSTDEVPAAAACSPQSSAQLAALNSGIAQQLQHAGQQLPAEPPLLHAFAHLLTQRLGRAAGAVASSTAAAAAGAWAELVRSTDSAAAMAQVAGLAAPGAEECFEAAPSAAAAAFGDGAAAACGGDAVQPAGGDAAGEGAEAASQMTADGLPIVTVQSITAEQHQIVAKVPVWLDKLFPGTPALAQNDVRVVPEQDIASQTSAVGASGHAVTPAALSQNSTGIAQAEQAHLPPAARLGVRLSALLRLIEAVVRASGEVLGLGALDVTTKHVVEHWVKPLTACHGKPRLAQLRGAASCLSDGDTGVPHYFISHAWGMPLGLLRRTVEGFLTDSNPDTTYVWVDFLAVNQHFDRAENAQDVAAFKDVLLASQSGTIVVMDAFGEPAKRAWCIYEVRIDERIIMPTGPQGSCRAQLQYTTGYACGQWAWF